MWPWSEIASLKQKLRMYRLETKDTDLPAANRTQANLWKAMYLEQYKETRNAHKGIKRLKNKLKRIRDNED